MTVRLLRSFILIVLPLMAIAAPATPPSPQTSSTLNEKLNVDLVDLYLTATNNKGGFITDLRADDLTVTENGVPQHIGVFTNFARDAHELPLTLVMMIDTSGSMSDDVGNVWKIDIAKEAASLLLDELKPNEKSMVVTFDENSTFSPLTSNKEEIRRTLQKVKVRFDGTALYDALIKVIGQMNNETGRKVLLLCSDGNDTISTAKLNQALEALSKSPDIAVIVLGTVSYKASKQYREAITDYVAGKDVLNKLADNSGGYAFFPETLKEVEKVRELLRQFLLSQYSLAYLPTNRNMDGSWRQIKITSRRKGVKLRYREGYYAVK